MPFVTANQNPVATGDALCKAEKTHNWYLLCFLLFVDTENFMTIDRRYFLINGIVGAACFAGPAARAQSGKTGGQKIVLGQSVPLTGAADQIGLAYLNGAKM